MSDESDVDTATMTEFRANHGKVGGPFTGAPLLLLHTVGRRSGTPRVHPTMYLEHGGRYLVFASRGGSDRNPDWYHNLLAHPDTRIEIGDDIIEVHAEELHGQERDDRYAEQAERFPVFARYEKQTPRRIPVIALTPLGDTTRVDKVGG